LRSTVRTVTVLPVRAESLRDRTGFADWDLPAAPAENRV